MNQNWENWPADSEKLSCDSPQKYKIDDDQNDVQVIQKPRAKTKIVSAKKKKKKTPKPTTTNKTPAKIEDGIIGMKVRSPTNRRN